MRAPTAEEQTHGYERKRRCGCIFRYPSNYERRSFGAKPVPIFRCEKAQALDDESTHIGDTLGFGDEFHAARARYYRHTGRKYVTGRDL